jgi:flagellar basal-body rod modification protein FlgD
MSSVSSVSYNSPAALTTNSTSTGAVPQQQLGQDDFLKLLAQQFQSQDPLKPMDDTSFIAQMAQFSALQQSSTMSKTLTAMQTDQQRATANSYLGHRVTVDVGDGTTASGDVTAIDNSGSSPTLVVNGNAYALSSVLRVEPAAISNNPSQSAASNAGQ